MRHEYFTTYDVSIWNIIEIRVEGISKDSYDVYKEIEAFFTIKGEDSYKVIINEIILLSESYYDEISFIDMGG